MPKAKSGRQGKKPGLQPIQPNGRGFNLERTFEAAVRSLRKTWGGIEKFFGPREKKETIWPPDETIIPDQPVKPIVHPPPPVPDIPPPALNPPAAYNASSPFDVVFYREDAVMGEKEAAITQHIYNPDTTTASSNVNASVDSGDPYIGNDQVRYDQSHTDEHLHPSQFVDGPIPNALSNGLRGIQDTQHQVYQDLHVDDGKEDELYEPIQYPLQQPPLDDRVAAPDANGIPKSLTGGMVHRAISNPVRKPTPMGLLNEIHAGVDLRDVSNRSIVDPIQEPAPPTVFDQIRAGIPLKKAPVRNALIEQDSERDDNIWSGLAKKIQSKRHNFAHDEPYEDLQVEWDNW